MALKRLCDKHGVNFSDDSWWPNMKDLTEEEIPVYRFLQKPGDLVWVNSGCVHWVQADGWCNNITWNVAPLTLQQFKLALEHFEWNKMQFQQSTIPMTSLTWNIARNVRMTDTKLFEMIKTSLMQSLKQVSLTVEKVKSRGVECNRHPCPRNDPVKYCGLCECECFAMYFVREEQGKGPMVHCLSCALRKIPDLKGFVCLEEFRLKELMEVYDSFKLYSVQTQAPVASSPAAVQQSYTSSPSVTSHHSQASQLHAVTASKSAREKAANAKAAAAFAAAMAGGSMTQAEIAAAAALMNQYSSFGAGRMDLG